MPEAQGAAVAAATAHSDLKSAPIGVFDSGVGGLSVLRALLAELPHEQFVYVADSGHAPYGERGEAFVAQRTRVLSNWLRHAHGIKAMVVACNTATAAAIHEVRANHPDLPLVGIEPAIKPAAANTATGRVGVMATRGTVQSGKFQRLLHSLQGQAHFVVQACDGLADAIERNDATKIEALCADYTRAMGPFGPKNGQIDTLVLGCTHYPFAQDILRAFTGPDVRFLEGGAPVARQTRKLLQTAGLLAPPCTTAGTQFLTSGATAPLAAAIERWLQMKVSVDTLPPEQAV